MCTYCSVIQLLRKKLKHTNIFLSEISRLFGKASYLCSSVNTATVLQRADFNRVTPTKLLKVKITWLNYKTVPHGYKQCPQTKLWRNLISIHNNFPLPTLGKLIYNSQLFMNFLKHLFKQGLFAYVHDSDCLISAENTLL